MFRTKFYWKQRKNKIRAVIKIPDGEELIGNITMKKYVYVNNWGEIYANYIRNFVTFH